jgi:predicted naringenin-chalcone synthase
METMKTTLDIPNDLYREAKATAALERIRMKDLVAEGLQLALAARGKSKLRPSPLDVLNTIRRSPLHAPEVITRIMEEQNRLRKEGWTREGEG